MDLLESKGVQKVTGIDLFSYDERVTVMDMHDINFDDGSFDLVYASHSLEHSYDYIKVFKEIIRVLKNGGIICAEVPVNFEPKGADISNFQSAENLINYFKKLESFNVLYEKNIDSEDENNYSGNDVSRIILLLAGPRRHYMVKK